MGARDIEHPGGTLHEHLLRVERTLREWGNDDDVALAGLCHAAYGTDGFDRSLLELSERSRLVAEIGWRAESLVYLYGACDRAVTYPRLTGVTKVPWHDRFTGTDYTVSGRDLAAFLEITAANELDVFAHNEELARRYRPGLLRLLERNRALLSEKSWQAIGSGA